MSINSQKNNVKLTWFPVENATGYNVYRDGEMVNATADNSYTDFNLKYETEYSYTTSTLDHQADEGDQSNNVFTSTHPKISKLKLDHKIDESYGDISACQKTSQTIPNVLANFTNC